VPKPSDSDEVKAHFGTLQHVVRESIDNAQQQLGRKMTAQELTDHIDGMFAKNITFRNSFVGIPYGTSQQPLLSMKIGDLPGDTRDALRASFAKRGVANPSDSDMLTAYLKWKTNAKQ
jgi:soluble lytic murein transglycosylase